MTRLGGLRPSNGQPAFGEVSVRRAGAPKAEWSPEQAIALLQQGYSVPHVATRTGYDERWLAAQQRSDD
ncbi:hypothetical protein [Motilibacter aurantiacus]|uniref:hypothetical protein n=1 Tax=Motilibacter aurantiacus TaxID=2714955 RepID=UPI00140DD7F9|nr:hypothetical protein [Motilibacter aurantiacus]NHC44973.1 hypothetical protein [Motilibacter aurantiacus]